MFGVTILRLNVTDLNLVFYVLGAQTTHLFISVYMFISNTVGIRIQETYVHLVLESQFLMPLKPLDDQTPLHHLYT